LNIYDQQIAQGRMLMQFRQFKEKELKALQDIGAALKIASSPYVALSWGKQSSILMHQVFRVNTTIPGVFWVGPESDIIANFSEVARQFQEKWNIIYLEQFCEHDFKNTAKS